METIDEITDEQILNSLLVKKEKLANELKRLNYDLQRLNIAIEIYQPKINGTLVVKKLNAEQLDRGEYSLTFSAVEQLHFALKHLGSATLLEISNCIFDIDDRMEIGKLRKRLTDAASLEYRKNRINGYKSEGRYIYSLKE